jgi:hypothetical protein
MTFDPFSKLEDSSAESVFRRYLAPRTRDPKAWEYLSEYEGGTYPDQQMLACEFLLGDDFHELTEDEQDAVVEAAEDVAAEAIELFEAAIDEAAEAFEDAVRAADEAAPEDARLPGDVLSDRAWRHECDNVNGLATVYAAQGRLGELYADLGELSDARLTLARRRI